MTEKKPIDCPICHAKVARDGAAYPFCTERCRLIDLGNWLGGKYAIPGDKPTSSQER